MENAEKKAWRIPWKGILVALICSAIALVLVFSKVAKPEDVLKELAVYPKGFFYGALFFVFAAWIVDGQRIGMLTRAIGKPISWWQLALMLGAANFLTLVTPFAGGGGALIVYLLYRRGISLASGTAVVIAGGMAGQFTLSTLILALLFLVKEFPLGLAPYVGYLRWIIAGYIIILVILVFIITKSKRILHRVMQKRGPKSKSLAWLEEFRSTYRFLMFRQKRYYFACLVMALFYYLTYYSAGFILLSGFGVFEPLLRYTISVLFGIAPVFSPIPGGAGASELVVYKVLEGSLQSDALGTFIILWRTVIFYIPILLGGSVFAFLAFYLATTKRQQEIQDESELQ
ncbi:MAG TPA: flippase-like domain-containing protein [Natronincola sp.]|nr:flippase-like domain-containing protein [Natronincola sp.]